MKGVTSVSIDKNLIAKAQLNEINVSGVLEDALKKKLNYKEIEIKQNCEFCGKEEEKAGRHNEFVGLTWLYPDEKWICSACVRRKAQP